MQGDLRAYQASANELDELLEHWPYKRNRILFLLAAHEALVQRGGREADESQLLDSGKPAHQALVQRLQRAAARAADPQRANRHHQAEREARSWWECQKLYGGAKLN